MFQPDNTTKKIGQCKRELHESIVMRYGATLLEDRSRLVRFLSRAWVKFFKTSHTPGSVSLFPLGGQSKERSQKSTIDLRHISKTRLSPSVRAKLSVTMLAR